MKTVFLFMTAALLFVGCASHSHSGGCCTGDSACCKAGGECCKK